MRNYNDIPNKIRVIIKRLTIEIRRIYDKKIIVRYRKHELRGFLVSKTTIVTS